MMSSFYNFKPWAQISTEDGVYRYKVLEALSHTPDNRPVVMMLTTDKEKKNLRDALQEIVPIIMKTLKLSNEHDAIWLGEIMKKVSKDGFEKITGHLVENPITLPSWGPEKDALTILQNMHAAAKSSSLRATAVSSPSF